MKQRGNSSLFPSHYHRTNPHQVKSHPVSTSQPLHRNTPHTSTSLHNHHRETAPTTHRTTHPLLRAHHHQEGTDHRRGSQQKEAPTPDQSHTNPPTSLLPQQARMRPPATHNPNPLPMRNQNQTPSHRHLLSNYQKNQHQHTRGSNPQK